MNKNQRRTASQEAGEHNHTERKRRPLKRGVRMILTLIILSIIIVLIAFVFRMFGGVDISSSDIGNTSETSAASTTSAAESAQTSRSASASATKTASTAKVTSDGHYVQPENAEWNLKLVNPWNPINSNYAQSLVTYAGGNKFDSRAIDKLKAIVKAGNGRIRVASLYRSIEQQKHLFENQVAGEMSKGLSRAQAEIQAAKLVARPGTSEHNLGLAVDFLFDNNSQLLESYEKTATYTWIIEHCADYGFIIRFPKNKQSVTGVSFEPWHYRYVGEEAAREIMSRRITLEEYLQEKGK